MDVETLLAKAKELPADRKETLLMMNKALLKSFIDPKVHAILVWVENDEMLNLATANASETEGLAMLMAAVDAFTVSNQTPVPQGDMH